MSGHGRNSTREARARRTGLVAALALLPALAGCSSSSSIDYVADAYPSRSLVDIVSGRTDSAPPAQPPEPAPLAAMALAALAGVNLWLLTIIVAGATGNEPALVAAPAWDAKLSGSGPDAAAAKPISAYGQMLAQPVFFKSRAPYVAPPPPPVAPPAPAVVQKPAPPPIVDPGFTVAGVIIGQSVRKAYIHTKNDQQGNWVSEGENLTGWKVQAIDPAGVKLQQQDRTIELELYPMKSDDHVPPAPAPRGMAGPAPTFLKQNPLPPAAGR